MHWGRRLHSAPATTLREQSQRSKPCTAAGQVKEKQVEVSFRSWEQRKLKGEGEVITVKRRNEGFCSDMLCVLVFHLVNHKDDYIPLYLFIWVLECREFIVIFGEILWKKTFAILLHLFHFPGVCGNGINVFLSKVSLNGKIQNDKVLDFGNMTVKTGTAGPLGLNVACHFKGTKARYITCPRCLDSVEQSHMVFWTKLPIP